MRIPTNLFYLLPVFILYSCKTSQGGKSFMREVSIIPRTEWKAAAPRSYAKHDLVRITVHHEGTRLLPTDDAARKIKGIQTWGMGPDRNWADVPYHFLIAPDGKIYEGRDVYTAGETNTEYDPTGHLLICCLGNYEEQEVPEEQLTSLIRMIAWCSKTYKIPVETLATHRDYSRQTSCPGKNLYLYFTNGYINKEVKKLLRQVYGL
ncbi:MAG: N-acetylmuramoyl-L-alanine amidase [Bacteroidetes bacterium]|nr:N-acetylmuramoyl-L-alanine amidase [Bacteroidota bacterium]